MVDNFIDGESGAAVRIEAGQLGEHDSISPIRLFVMLGNRRGDTARSDSLAGTLSPMYTVPYQQFVEPGPSDLPEFECNI